MDFFGIHFAQSQYFYTIILFFAVAVYLMYDHRRLVRGLRTLFHSSHRTLVFPGFSVNRKRIKTTLMVISLFFLFCALMQPQWGKKEQVVEQEGRDVLIVLDISRSMLAQDVRPNRLEFTKLKIRNLISRLDAERMGLILFSGSAFLQCPLTADRDAFLMFLDQVDVETIASGTTALDGALAKAVQVFGASKGRKNKLVVLLTDGEDFSRNLSAVQRRAAKENVRVFSLGIGTTQGAPVPIVNQHGKIVGHEKKQDGSIATTKLNEKMLQEISTQLHGQYVKATHSDADINAVVAFIRKFEKEKFADKKMSMYQDQYPWFLAVAWALLALEWIL